MKNIYKLIRFQIFVAVMIAQLFSISRLWSTTHVILFGGGVGFQYSPSNLTLALGDTVQWQGTFSLHPLSSTTIPAGAVGWNVSTGSVFNYRVEIAGIYNYQCNVHSELGMVGSFTAPPSLGIPTLLSPDNNIRGVQTNPTLKWSKVSAAITYHLEVSNSSSFLTLVINDSLLTDTSKQISALSYNSQYYWRIRAKDLTTTGEWSSPFSFTTQIQPSIHTILFGGGVGFQYSPKDIEVIAGDTIQWLGDFASYPLSSTVIPGGASSWHLETGTVFNYSTVLAGMYKYQCDFHFISGMVGSFFAVDYSPLVSPNLLLPANASSGIPINPTIVWNSQKNTSRYHLQISTTSNFLNIVQEDTLLADTLKQITGLTNNTIYYWRVRGKNILTVGPWSIQRNFKTIQEFPFAPVLLYPDSAAVDQPSTILIGWGRVSIADSYYVQLSTDSLFNSLVSSRVTADTSALIINLSKDSIYFWRVSSKNNAGVSPWSIIWRFTTSASMFNLSLAINDLWNMVSIPLAVIDNRKSILFPTATSSAFSYSSGYTVFDTLEKGKGYWIRFAFPQTVQLSGDTYPTDTIRVSAGWNMVGSIFKSLPVSSISSMPGGLVTSSFFSYNGSSYASSDSISPGKGYWVKIDQPGLLILSSSPDISQQSRIIIKQISEKPPTPPETAISESHDLPMRFSLSQNYPDPFNPQTKISFSVPKESFITLKIYDFIGREVATLVQDKKQQGEYSVSWDANNISSGIYFYRLVSEDFIQTKKMVLMK